jgi:phosphoribosylformimino-5-aminoimidazole carboxamide ribotide isomerase
MTHPRPEPEDRASAPGEHAADPATTFAYYPAIDIRHGRVVRLVHGDPGAETVYGEDPATTARDLVRRGATRLHVVDLDAALGEGGAPDTIRSIAATVGSDVEVQVGGGLRDASGIDAALAAGASRVVLGTAALRDPGLVADAVARHGAQRIAVALDVRGGIAVGEGWSPAAPGRPYGAVVRDLAAVGVRRFIATAIARDGTLDGPDLALLAAIVACGAPEVVASAGIRSLADLVAAADAGCVGAVVGRATYDGGLDPAVASAWAATRRVAAAP